MTGAFDSQILKELEGIKVALTRQADVMERDVEAERGALTPDQVSAIDNVYEIMQKSINNFGHQLEGVVTGTYPNDMYRAKAIRDIIEVMKNYTVGGGPDGQEANNT